MDFPSNDISIHKTEFVRSSLSLLCNGILQQLLTLQHCGSQSESRRKNMIFKLYTDKDKKGQIRVRVVKYTVGISTQQETLIQDLLLPCRLYKIFDNNIDSHCSHVNC